MAVQAVYATGTVEATVMMPIAAKSAARLMQLNVDEGSDVTRGQVLGQLEDTDLQNALEGLRAREKFAAADFERKESLLTRGFQTRATVDQARSEWNAARAATAQMETQIGYLKLVSPADGRIISRDGEIGQLIPANQPVFWLSCCAPLRISAEVDEEDISRVKTGQEVLIRADAFPGRVFHGKVQSITPKGDPVARSYRVRVEFVQESASGNLPGNPLENPMQIGMTAETNIITGKTENALLVPASAVNQDRVWLVRDGRLVEQPVSVGARGPKQTEIREGLTESDTVVLKPNASLKAGRKVRVVIVQQAE
jgi:multidrug efflux system membrane fusion protein